MVTAPMENDKMQMAVEPVVALTPEGKGLYLRAGAPMDTPRFPVVWQA